MATEQLTEWVLDHHFDRESCRHTVNGLSSVLHCHHYASLYCQLADDADDDTSSEIGASALEAKLVDDVFGTF